MGAAASTAPADGASTNITNEAFVGGLRHLLDLAAEGYPRGVRSTLGRRNALLRDRGGDADAAAAAAATASTLADDAFDTIVALVPYFGLPAGVAAPLWRKLRASLLLAAVRGHDVAAPETRARALGRVAGLRASEAASAGVEMAAQAVVWRRREIFDASETIRGPGPRRRR